MQHVSRVPAEFSHWSFHTLGATGTPRSSLRTRETWRGLRLTHLGPDQTSLLCKIYNYDQWTPTGVGPVLTSAWFFFGQKHRGLAPQLQTLFPSPRCALPAVDPGQRGSSYLDHPPWCRGGGHRVPGRRGVGSEPS